MYDIARLLNLLDSILGGHKSFANQEYYYFCPFCHHYNPKLAVNLNKQAWHCWKCSKSGRSIRSLLRGLNASREDYLELGAITQEFVPTKILGSEEPQPLTLPQEFRPLRIAVDSIEYMRALTYVHLRGLTMDDIYRYQIGYCESGPYGGRIIVPSFDDANDLNYFVGRSYTPNTTLNYRNPPVTKNVIGFENQINWNHPIILTEGVFDAMATKRNAIPLFGTHVPKKLQQKIIKHGINEVYLALDKDALKLTLRIAEQLYNNGVNVYVVDMDGKDPSAMGFAATQQMIRKATKLTFLSLMKFKLSLVG